ncbi:MAG: RpiB/LacA/LacB family sugar-phosphate isomerase, partial [Eggerthellaceae bacterium]|nr:RpiB/LacA/LacB family sugar-phosphate isomerase [Eggerthellaceae bacterium]
MKLYIGADHAGFAQKEAIKAYLADKGFEVKDCGAYSDERTDYPLCAIAVCNEVAKDDESKGILICGTGVGMCMAANKIRGIRAANITSPEFATLCVEHNN